MSPTHLVDINAEIDAERLVRAARDLFWDRGYDGVSVADIEATIGLADSDLELHFGGKRGLYDAAVGDYLSSVVHPRLEAMKTADDARAGLLGYFENLAHFITEQGAASGAVARADSEVATRGCLLLDSAAGLAAHDAEQRRAVVAYRIELETAFAVTLKRAIPDAAGDVIARKARQLLAISVSAMVLARVDPVDAVQLLGAADEVIW